MTQNSSVAPRVVFMGSGPFALPALEALDAHTTVVGVVTQPDRAIGRGRNVQRGLLAASADRLGLPVVQPTTFKDPEAVEAVRSFAPEVVVVASYGRILPRAVLEIPSRGSLNLHPSLLPRHRGPSPVAWTILSGDEVTAVTVMEMVSKMDAGPIVSQRRIAVAADDTTESLTRRLAVENSRLLLETLPEWVARSVTPESQREESATYTHLLTKEMGLIDWSKSAVQLEREVRGFIPWPVSYTDLGGQLRVLAARVRRTTEPSSHKPGEVVSIGPDGITVQTGQGVLLLEKVQPQGGKVMAAADYARGRPSLATSAVGY